MNDDYKELNLTELVELARRAGFLRAHRGVGRAGLVGLLEGTADEEDFNPDPIDEDRESMLMLQEEWPDVFDQLSCSADSYACWLCPAGRVVHCVQNWADDVRAYRDEIKRGIKRRKW